MGRRDGARIPRSARRRVMRARRRRSTSTFFDGFVSATTRITTSRSFVVSTPSTEGPSMTHAFISASFSSSSRNSSNSSSRTPRTCSGSSPYAMRVDDRAGPPSRLVAHEHDVAVRHDVQRPVVRPEGGRPQREPLDPPQDRVRRRSISTMSPTPNWFSSRMKNPVSVSLTMLCAPNPSATPAIPALAMNGARGTSR